MKPTGAARPHGGVRGQNLSRSSVLFQGAFGRIFRTLPAADYGTSDDNSLRNLAILGAAMSSDPDGAKDGPDSEESGIPAAFTYFGQFIDHDLTFDPASSLQKQNDPDGLVDYRTPRFDLDNVYGRGPDDQPYLYADGISLLRGPALSGASQNPNATDLPRSVATPQPGDDPAHPTRLRAIIGDPRNDENKIVSQFQGIVHRYHNRVAKENSGWTFAQVQRAVRFHYQWVVLHDFLPKIVSAAVLQDIVPGGIDKIGQVDTNLKYYHPRDEAFMPLEFSAAAYRFGHSMVRPGYRLSDTVPPVPIFAIPATTPPGNAVDLRGFAPPPDDWAIDWRRFIDLVPLPYGTLVDNPDQTLPANQNRLQLAYKIDTALVNPLALLPQSVVNADDPPPSLGARNLQRGWRMRLPTGQDVARAMGLKPLEDTEIKIGQFTGDAKDIKTTIDQVAGGVFAGNCPLWTYILAETVPTDMTVVTTEGNKSITTYQLGPVGGRIVAETFIGLLQTDSSSYLSQDPLWTPTFGVEGTVFGLREFVQYALGD
jgi:hypothetical protein